VALALLGLIAPACRRHRRPRRARPHSALASTTTTAGRYAASPPAGPGVRVATGHYLAGALRLTDTDVAAAPWPASPFVATAQTDAGWRFATADGSLFASPTFLGPLRRIGALPTRLPLVRLDDRMHFARAVHSVGALVAHDAQQDAWVVGPDDRPLRLPQRRVLDGAFRDARTGLFVCEPGLALRTDDGGRSLVPVVLPDGASAYRVALQDNVLRLYTTAGVLRLEGATLVAEANAPPLGRWLAAQRAVDAVLRTRGGDPRVLPRDATQAALRTSRSLAVIAHEHLTLVDVQSALESEHIGLPGTACALGSAMTGLRAVCTHGGWARAVFGLSPAGQWNLLRDELRDEPLGDIAFDTAGPSWAVGAPCVRSAGVDPTRLCWYDGHGGRREVTLPFDGSPVALHDGTLLAIEAARTEGTTRAALLRGETVNPIDLPFPGDVARSLRLEAGVLSAWVRREDGRMVLLRGRLDAGPVVHWTEHPAPAGCTQGVLGPDDSAFAYGDTAETLVRSVRGGEFRRLPSPVDGHPGAYALDPEGPSYCVGPRCVFAGSLEWIAGSETGPAPLLARRDAPPPVPPTTPAWPSLRCTRGSPVPRAPVPAAQALMAGYGVRWQQAPGAFTARWEGSIVASLQGPIVPRGAGVQMVVRLAPGASRPLGLFERCDDAGCDLVLGAGATVQTLALPGGVVPSGSDVQWVDAGRAIVRAFVTGDGHTSTLAWTVDTQTGALTGPTTVVHHSAPEALGVGTLAQRIGLWIPGPDATVYFHPLDRNEAAASTLPAPSPATPLCTASFAATASLRLAASPYALAGDAWHAPTLPWRTGARYALSPAGPCLAQLEGGTDEAPATTTGTPEALQGFALRAEDGRLVGDGWTRTQRVPLRCTLGP